MEQKIPIEVGSKYVMHFGEEVKVEENFAADDPGKRYVYRVVHKGANYVLKGYRIALERLNSANSESVELFKQGLVQVSEVLQEYHFAKATAPFNPHIAQPLSLNFEIEVPEEEDSCPCMHIQIVFEYAGVALDRLEPATVEATYNLMRQSAGALSLLHNLGVTNFDVKPSSMVYDGAKDLLKFVNMGSAFGCATRTNSPNATVNLDGKIRSGTPAFAPPEMLKMAEGSEVAPSLGMTMPAIDVYCWGMSFYSLLSNRKSEELESEYMKYKLGSEAEYGVFMKLADVNFNSVKTKNATESSMMETIKNLISSSLSYKPKERPEMKEIVGRMRDFERRKKVALRYAQTEAGHHKNFKDLLMMSEQPRKMSSALGEMPEESKGDDVVELKCGHAMAKEYLVNYMLELFLKRQPCEYSCMCSMCREPERLKSVTLNCGCTLTKFGDKVEFSDTDYGKCREGKPRTATDLCILNDYTSFKLATMMLSEYPIENRSPTLMDLLNESIRKENAKDIAWILCSTDLVTVLDITNSKIGDEGAKAIAEAVKINTSLSEIFMGKNNIGNEGARTFGEALKVNTMLTVLDLRENKVGNEGAKIIGEALKANKTLTRLELRGNKIGNEGLIAIGEALKVNSTLARLNIGRNKFGVEGVRAVCDALVSNKGLIKLSLADSSIGTEGAKFFEDALRSNKTMTQLDLSDNKIGDEGVKYISDALKVNSTLTFLLLWNNNIGVEGTRYIDDVLRTNTTLTHLELNGNKIGVEGLKHISEMLRANKTLTKISLSDTKIGVEGAKLIGNILETNSTLKKLEIHGTSIGDEGTRLISEVLETNTTLLQLELRNNNIGVEGARAIGKALNSNATLTHLELNTNKVGDDGARLICEALKTNTTLTQLRLRSNNIGYKGAVAISEMLRVNKTLTLLDLHINNVADDGTKLIAEALKANETLTQLNLRMNNIGIVGAKFIEEALKMNTTIESLDLRENKIAVEGRETLKRITEHRKTKILFH
eukprot:TRINITY_DN2345_c0_g2_i1.p1 TRINITY_DN2345_c0_g2~~TRINITY_DN2345_c0_g2_i1.p1  ORF type:complete len:1000 (+),score=345.26 TRINITY_DN2345_c0_g2_i1:219-3218(+)